MQLRIGFSGLMLGVCCAAALGVDVARPAVLQVVVRERDRPLAGVALSLERLKEGRPAGVSATARSDAQGRVRFTQLAPAEGVAWDVLMRVEGEAHLAKVERFAMFAGAQIERTVALEPRRATTVRVVGPDGRPLQGVALSFQHGGVLEWPGPFTNEQGMYVWQHAPQPEGFTVSAGRHREQFADGRVAEIRLTREEMEGMPIQRVLEGKLLLPDGAPAAGWFVTTGEANMWMSPGIVGYAFGTVQTVGADGTFRATMNSAGRVTGGLLAISPEGVPQLFEVNSDHWEAGPRRVTVTLPKPTTVMRRQVVDGQGKPVSGLRIRAASVDSNGRHWVFHMNGAPQGAILAGDREFGTVTDAAGWFEWKLPPETRVQAGAGGGSETWLRQEDGERMTLVRTRGTEPANPADLKDVVVKFRDERGNVLEGLTATLRVNSPAAANGVAGSGEAARDGRGQHFFIDKAARVISLNLYGPGWKQGETAASLNGERDEEITITLAEARRLKAIRGQLVDPAGRPVAGAMVAALIRVTPGGALGGVGASATTDGAGRFEIAGAPDECELVVYRFNAKDERDLPGWVAPVKVTAGNREVRMELREGSTVTALLPPGVQAARVTMKSLGSTDGDLNKWLTLTPDPASNTLVARQIPPGRYELTAEDVAWRVPPGDVEVREGQAAVALDWRRVETQAWALQPKRLVEVMVRSGRKAVSGVQVGVFVNTVRPEVVNEWIEQWRTGEAGLRATLEEKLAVAGPVALDALPAGDGALAALRRTLLSKQMSAGDGLELLAMDLTSDEGTVRFQGQVGREYVAVAHLPGVGLGWQLVKVGATGGLEVELKPVRTVGAKLPAWIPPHNFASDGREVTVRFVEPAGMEGRALTLMRRRDMRGVVRSPREFMMMRREVKGLDVQLEDLPVGVELEVKANWVALEGRTNRVRIEGGEGIQVLRVPGE